MNTNTLKDIYSPVSQEMAEVNSLISKCLTAQKASPYLAEVCSGFLRISGKGLRPVLVLLAGKCCHSSIKRLVNLAAALELIHMASLVHDDIIDRAAIRRGNATVNAQWGNHAAVLLGDYFYARALELSAPLGVQVNKGLAEIISELVGGEFRQMENKFRDNLTESEYLETVSGKTAKFISLCCRLGAGLGKSSSQTIDSLSMYGFYTGMAYQIIDDVMDIAGSASRTGKNRGQDLFSGVITLPVIHALNTGHRRERISEILAQNSLTEDDLRAVRKIIRQAGSIEYSLAKAREYICRARGSLQVLPVGRARDALDLLAEYICHGQIKKCGRQKQQTGSGHVPPKERSWQSGGK